MFRDVKDQTDKVHIVIFEQCIIYIKYTRQVTRSPVKRQPRVSYGGKEGASERGGKREGRGQRIDQESDRASKQGSELGSKGTKRGGGRRKD